MKSQPCAVLRTGLKVSVVDGVGGAKSFSLHTTLFMVRLGYVEVELGL